MFLTSRMAASISLMCLTGCGTIMNMPAPCHGPETPLQVYGGVRNDLKMAKSNLDSMGKAEANVRAAKMGGCALLALDLPLSLAADTVLLPVTACVSLSRMRDQQKQAEAKSGDSNEK